MRHEKTANLIELARHLSASSIGLTLDEMAQRAGVGRRTVERMRDRLLELFPDLEEIADPPTKRWRLPGGLPGFLQSPDAEELAALNTARELLAPSNPQASGALSRLERKLLSALKGRAKTRLETDIEALMQAEAIAVQPGPRPLLDPARLRALREAILSLKQVAFHYSGGTGAPRRRTVSPWGLLFGGEAYLVGPDVKADPERLRMWRLDRIGAVEVLEVPGGPPDSFSLKDYSEQSFGVFHETTVDVVLHILPDAVEEARRFVFHPAQVLEDAPDGGLIVRLHGGGLRELAWSLMRWGGKLRIVEPQRLKDLVAQVADTARGMAD